MGKHLTLIVLGLGLTFGLTTASLARGGGMNFGATTTQSSGNYGNDGAPNNYPKDPRTHRDTSHSDER